eukprot:2763287-Amphidinium_carterae.1
MSVQIGLKGVTEEFFGGLLLYLTRNWAGPVKERKFAILSERMHAWYREHPQQSQYDRLVRSMLKDSLPSLHGKAAETRGLA